MDRTTDAPMRAQMRRDAAGWPGRVEALCDDINELAAENERLVNELQVARDENERLRTFIQIDYDQYEEHHPHARELLRTYPWLVAVATKGGE